MVPFSIGMMGALATLWISTQVFESSWVEALRAILAANVAALISLVLTLQAEKIPSLKRTILRGYIPTWIFITAFYLVILLGIDPALRDGRRLLWLFLPLFMSTSFMFPLFGIIQDHLVRRAQRK